MEREFIHTHYIEKTLRYGDVVEKYDTDEEARYLMHWKVMDEPVEFHIHVVAADQSRGRTVVITAYNPAKQADRWSDDYKRRLQ